MIHSAKKTTLWGLGLTVALVNRYCLAVDYPIVDTGQQRCYDHSHEIVYPQPGAAYFGQDAQYVGLRPSYRDNNDGTVTDEVTGLMWQKDPGAKVTYAQAVAGAASCRQAGYDDWRLPSIKQLYSLIFFSGIDPDPQREEQGQLQPFLDTQQFVFRYGDAAKGERIIDSQYATSTRYVSTTMGGAPTMFGVNFADGRIKGYGFGRRGQPGRPEKTFYTMYVRGNEQYGVNQFHDNGDGTITDRATGLTWTQNDSGYFKAGPRNDGKLNWQQALHWAETLTHAGHSDWRLPNVKELQSLVDYTRSPDTTRSAAIDPVFQVTSIRNENGTSDFPSYWSSTTHARSNSGSAAAYVAFGRSLGWMQDFRGGYNLLDVHGAGSQRSDPKAGDPSRFPRGRGPQGDVIRIYNLARAVRGGVTRVRESGPALLPVPTGQRVGPPDPMDRQRPDRMGPPGRGGAGFVTRLDRDGDGKVSRDEFDGPADAFDRHDVDRDGYLTDAEAPHGPPSKKQPGLRNRGRR